MAFKIFKSTKDRHHQTRFPLIHCSAGVDFCFLCIHAFFLSNYTFLSQKRHKQILKQELLVSKHHSVNELAQEREQL